MLNLGQNHGEIMQKYGGRKIIHIDMDCFYAAVETKHHPEYRGRPLAVGGPPESRSVLCTANYEARRFGVKAAIPSSRAVRLCPQLILVPPHFDLYKEESCAIRKIFERFTDKIEPLSLDEAYLDVTDCSDFKGSASLIAREIRKQIFNERALNASAGIAPNKFLAKVASDWNKPNNQFTLSPDKIEAFMPSLPVERIYGVGKVTARHLHERGIEVCGDIQNLSEVQLRSLFGRRWQEMRDLAFGIDHRSVCTEWERKSLSVEETFPRDLQNFDEIRKSLAGLYEDFQRRMDQGQYWDRVQGWVVKLKFFDFKSTTHEMSNPNRPQIENFEMLLRASFAKISKPVRLVGIGVRLKNQNQTRSQNQKESSFSSSYSSGTLFDPSVSFEINGIQNSDSDEVTLDQWASLSSSNLG